MNELLQCCKQALPWIEESLYTLIEGASVIGKDSRPVPGTLDDLAKPDVRELRKLVSRLKKAIQVAERNPHH